MKDLRLLIELMAKESRPSSPMGMGRSANEAGSGVDHFPQKKVEGTSLKGRSYSLQKYVYGVMIFCAKIRGFNGTEKGRGIYYYYYYTCGVHSTGILSVTLSAHTNYY